MIENDINRNRKVVTSLSGAIALFALATCSPAFAQIDEDKKFLLLYFTEEELVVESATRSMKPVSQVAENVSVITAKEIELMNAHTAADVLNKATGIQVSSGAGPGSLAAAFIQGSDQRHVTLLIDGIPVNNLSDNIAELGSIPVQNIERIEIIKGPGSSAWGSALGGVINIITKSGRNHFGGMASASYGEKNTGDFRAEASGKEGTFGYYVNAGRLQTDGHRPHFNASNDNAYAKFAYDLTKKTSLQFTLAYIDGYRGDGEDQSFDLSFDNEFSALRSSLSAKTALNNEASLRVSLWSNRQKFASNISQWSTGTLLSNDHYTDQGYGTSADVTLKNHQHNLVFGLERDSKSLESNTIFDEQQVIRKSGVYANDTLSFEDLSVTPGIRYDDTSTNDDFTSPSLGVTYRLAGKTILRAYAAKGFNIPPLIYTSGDNVSVTANPDLKMEQVRSYQAGAETAALKYFWLKFSAFRHEVRDAIVKENISGPMYKAINSGRQRRQGAELELKTSPVYNISLTAGAEYIDAKDLNTGRIINYIPRYVYDVGLLYEAEREFQASLKGRYIDWNSDPAFPGKYGNIIFDLNVIGKIQSASAEALDLFMTVHNITDKPQYPVSAYENAGRWIEAGVRYRF